jgi:uncharacterized protein DUF3883
VANYLLYWKDYWKDVKNHPTDINFNWYTARKAFFNRVRANDNLWLVSSVRKPQPAKWALVARVLVQRKREIPSLERPFRIIGNPSTSQRFDYRVQSDLTSTLRNLDFASGIRIKARGRAIGKALQSIRRLTDRDVVLLSEHTQPTLSTLENSLEDAIKKGGAGFGDPETNRKVERAAISHVESRYCSAGWVVKSREKDHVGYDLLCTKGNKELYLEVKGIRQTTQSFIITKKEKETAKDPRFKLCIVTSALTNPELIEYTGSQFLQQFDFTALVFRSDLRKAGDADFLK